MLLGVQVFPSELFFQKYMFILSSLIIHPTYFFAILLSLYLIHHNWKLFNAASRIIANQLSTNYDIWNLTYCLLVNEYNLRY